MSPRDGEWLVAAVGPLPGPPRLVRAGRQAELLSVLGLRDPVPPELRPMLATTWRALAEGVTRVYVAPDAETLASVPESLVVAGASAVPGSAQAGERLYLYDPPGPGRPGENLGPVPEGMVGLWPWVSLVLPGLPGPVSVPPSALVAGLFARGGAASTYPADAVPAGSPPPEGAGWVRLVPAGRRRLLHLDPAPVRPGGAFSASDGAADATTLELLWAEARATSNPVETFTRALKSRYGAGVRVFLEDDGLRVLFPPPLDRVRGVTVRFTRA